VRASPRERIDRQPFKRTLRQTPKHKSSQMNAIAINTIGLTGAKIESKESAKIEILVFIWMLIDVQFVNNLIGIIKKHGPSQHL
jgi:hypothetical protein